MSHSIAASGAHTLHLPSRGGAIALAVAAVLGAGAATATYAIVDNGGQSSSSSPVFINSDGGQGAASHAAPAGGAHP
jgi:hypothetical protein